MNVEIQRCSWAKTNLSIPYHDTEWGVPLFDDQKWFEFLILDAFQAGLTWELILTRRPHLRLAFADFNPQTVAQFDAARVEMLMQDANIIRNRLKIEAGIKNARAFLKVQNDYGSFSRYIWAFVDGSPIVNHWQQPTEVPATSREAEIISKDLKQKGFSFVGPTICYAIMQSAGLVNDHLLSCFRHAEISAGYSSLNGR
ncbi:MAG: DNA-3-methyladenine glycosylase I [Anaerolineae bacterium]|nr:DNA-3-methyladenine glycosylase I [Anaerolineae bacterium]